MVGFLIVFTNKVAYEQQPLPGRRQFGKWAGSRTGCGNPAGSGSEPGGVIRLSVSCIIISVVVSYMQHAVCHF